MDQILKRILAAALSAVSVLSLCACSGRPRLILDPEELYSLPSLPEKYTTLNTQLNAILENGAEYASPSSGTNVQSVQMTDLDGDGREEAVAFFRKADDEKPLKICVFSASGNDYRQTAVIEGSGTSVYSITYSDLDGDGCSEMVIGWRVSAELLALSVYSVLPDSPAERLQTDYVKYALADLNQDGKRELTVIRTDQDGLAVADYYDWKKTGGLELMSTTRLSATAAELSRVSAGALNDCVPALFVTSVTNANLAVTDVLTLRNHRLLNVTVSAATGFSTEVTDYCALYPADMDGDGVTEVPRPAFLSLLDAGIPTVRQIDWVSYSISGNREQKLSTYHDMENGWYLRLPEEWAGRIAVERSSTPEESRVTFWAWENGERGEEPLLRISAVGGSDRERRAAQGGRFTLGRQTGTIYTAELLGGSETWQYGVSEEQIRAAFSLIAAEWPAGDN